MLFQSILIQRIIILCLFQIWPILYFLILANKLLKRAKNVLTLTLSSYFIINAFGYSLSFVSILFIYTPLAYFFYLLTFYLILFSQSFIVIFSWLLVNLEKKISYKIYNLIVIIYGMILTYIFWVGYLLDGIKYDFTTGWIPVFNELFLIISWVYLSVFLIGPQTILTLKLLRTFEGVKLKKRIKKFLISAFLEYAIIYLLVLYNTWTDNIIFRTIFLVSNFLIGMLAAYYIYRSVGKELE